MAGMCGSVRGNLRSCRNSWLDLKVGILVRRRIAVLKRRPERLCCTSKALAGPASRCPNGPEKPAADRRLAAFRHLGLTAMLDIPTLETFRDGALRCGRYEHSSPYFSSK